MVGFEGFLDRIHSTFLALKLWWLIMIDYLKYIDLSTDKMGGTSKVLGLGQAISVDNCEGGHESAKIR